MARRSGGLRPSVYLSFKAARKKPGELLDRADTNRSEERDTLSRDLGLAVDEYLATTGEHFHDAFHPIRQARNFFGFSSASLSGRGDEGAAEDATDVKPGGAKRKAAPAAKGKATPAAKRKAAPAAKGKATPAAKGKATPAAKGKATPAAKGKATPAAKRKATPAAKGKATPAAKGKATPAAKGAPAPEAKDGKAAKGGNPTGAKAEADAEAEAEAKAAAEARKKVFPTVGSPVAAASRPAAARPRRTGTAALAVPDAPTAVVLGEAYDAASLSVAWQPPFLDGGATISAYRVEIDSSAGFDFHGDDYRVDEVAFVHEVQTVTTHFRAAESQRRGTFTLSWGGKTTAHLDHDASADEVADAVSRLTGVWDVGVPPVRVTRSRAARGYAWRVQFVGVYGNVGLLTADDSYLIGDDARIEVEEVTEGYCDVVSGGFSYEVQTVQVDALSTVSGSFKLSFEGQETASIAVDASAIEFKYALEALDTIFTANVVAEDYEPSKGPRLWTVTYTHQAHTLTQGAQDASLMVSDTADLSPSSTAEVVITERIKGADAFRYAFDGLDAGKEYFARVTAYNSAGYGPVSSVATATPRTQPGLPGTVAVAVASGTSLDVTWTPPNDDGGAPVLGYDIEWYSEETQDEVQVVTLSASDGVAEIQSVTTEADTDGLSGYFTLELRGETTEIISVDAPAEGEGSVKTALERLSSSGEIEVSRDYSSRVVRGVSVAAGEGKGFIEVSKGAFHQTGSSRLDQNDLVFVAGEQFRVRQIDYGAGRLELGSLDDFTTPAYFAGANVTDAPLTTWAFGYEWTVTFAGLVGEQPLLVAKEADLWAGTSPVLKVERVRFGQAPLKGTFALGFEGDATPPLSHDATAADVEAALEQLSTITDVVVARTVNNNGYNYEVAFGHPRGDVSTMYALDDMLTGPDAAARVATFTHGKDPDHYAVGDTPEVQAFGFYLLQADTNQGSLEATMDALDADLASVVPTFDISWDITDCGSAEGVNFCQLGVDEDSAIGTISCDSDPTNDCIAASIDLYDSSNALMSTADMETALNAMSYSGTQFMIDADGVGVNVTRTREIVGDVQAGDGSGTSCASCTGVYHVEYRVTFTGRHHRGNVPSIALTTSSALSTYSSTYGGYTAVSGSDTIGYLSSCCDSTCSSSCPDELGPVYLDDQVAYSILEGNQPDGSIKLEYECEARTSPLDSAAVTYGSTSALLNGAQVTVKKGDWVRLGTTSDSYYEVDKVYGDGSYQANVSFATAYAGSTAVLTDAEVGVFYSDPSSDDGVSSACATSRVRSTDVINVDASAATWSSTLRSVATIESASDYLVVTAAKPLPGNGSYVGLYVDVEFLAQHGDLKPMVCDTSYLTASSDATSAYCNVTTLQDGSLADGDFSLTTYWPNERVAKPSPFNATGLRWNSPSDTMDAVMERVGAGDGVSLAFGLGTTPAVVNEVLRTGSTPFSGTFSVAFNGAKTEEMEWQEAADEVEYVIEKLDTIGDKVQLEFERPLSDGGTNLSHYLIEYDTSDTFSSPKVFDVSASEVEAAALYEDGPSVVYATGLSAGTLYYVRVAAVNTVGTSAWVAASNPTAPAAAPDRVTFSSTDERSVPDGVAGVSGEGPGPSKKQCGPTTRSATRDARDAPAAPASVDDVAAGDSDEEELPELDLLARLSTVQRARLEALQGDGGVTIWSFAYAVGYKASAAAVGRIRAMLRAVCYDDGDDDAAIASLAADIGLECDLKVRTRKATREMIDALIKIWSRVLTLGGDTVLPRALRWALAVVMLDKIDLAGEEVDGEPQLVGLLRVLAAAGIVEQDPDDASVIGPGPAWREYAGELNGNARLPQLADFVGILMEMRLLRGVPCPGCLCASCHQGVNDVMTLVARLPAIKAAFPELGFKSEAEILKAHGVPATYSYEPADSEKYPTMPLNVLSFVTQRKIFGEVASGARPRIGVKIMDSATGKFDGKVWVLTAADVRNCSSRKHDGYSAEVLDLFAAAAYNATGVRYELREGVKKGGVYTMNVGVGPSTRAVRTFFQPRIKLYSDRNDTISGTVVLGTEFKIVELDDDGEEGATLLEKGVVPKPTAEAIAGAKAAFARDAAALRKARGLPTAEEKERARAAKKAKKPKAAKPKAAKPKAAKAKRKAAKPKAAPVAPTVIHPGVVIAFELGGVWYRARIPAGAVEGEVAMIPFSALTRVPGR
ncbi:hypothetical protein AURANDRAFT_67225 [Aureococcus anophagefferens]|uniref:Fibronectin type-III domain-containing protein n=1 Tax=Aureococcus anophagefferens TaxID=44056 RepID=F0YKF6_AURAN|nr:hypothetical protein AURANDRAFT_67225 [Aureococcus anophagefferens]EGB04335.1 hypothetical protein AURANDRAFT_67225 [Aureococcus anophagefferens]|eukprot:XP_009040893.1 hypothetical protein AURANDRAFT_67225 [Aureococcus anophagefferens]